MTDLSEKLDRSGRQRLIEAVRRLSPAEYRDLTISLLGGMGVRVQSAREQQGALLVHGQGEVAYLVLVSRSGFSDPEMVARSLIKDAKEGGRTPVLMTMQELDPGTLNLLEREGVSYADTDRFLSLLERYGLDEQLLVKEDLKVLEDRGEPCLPSVGKLEELLEEAERSGRKGDGAGAIRLLDQALQIKPLNDSIWLKKASYLLAMGRAAEALTAATRAAELRPGDAMTWYTIALIHNRLEDRERELAAYDNVLRIDPGNAPALLNKGATLYELGRLEWALKVFNDLVHRYPQDPRGWNNRGLALKGMGRAVEAQAAFEKASALDRDFADPLINLARMREERGDIPGAVEGWKDVLRLVDSRADIWAHLGTCLRALGELDDALTALDRALALDPSMEPVRREREDLVAQMAAARPGPAPVPGGTLDEEVVEGAKDEGSLAVRPFESGPPAEVKEEKALQVPDAQPPAEVSQERTVQPVGTKVLAPGPSVTAVAPADEAGRLEPRSEASVPLPFQGSPSAIEVAEGPEARRLVEISTGERTAEGEGKEGAPTQAPKSPSEWPFEVRLPPLPEGREARVWQEAALLLAGKEAEKALQVIDGALRQGDDPALLRLKARALLTLDRGEEAIEALKGALRLAPDDARVLLDIEALLHRHGGDASGLLRAAECEEARARLALGLLEGQRYGELARLNVDGAGLPARLSKSLALVRLGRYRDASKLLKTIISEFPAYPEGLNALGVCMRFMGEYDYEQAMHLMQLALEVDPHHSDAMNNIGCTLFAAGRYEAALEALKAAVDEERRPEYLLNLSNVQMAMGDTGSAKDSLTSALKMEESADALYMLGFIAEGEGEHKWALSLYQDALEKSPGFREAQAGCDRTKLLARK